MKKTLLLFLVLTFGNQMFAQTNKAPIYASCEEVDLTDLENCFIESIKADFLKLFVVPEKVKSANFQGKVIVLFTISTNGEYVINYINSNYESVKNEVIHVFDQLPKTKPAKYNGHTIESDYVLPFYIPLEENFKIKEPLVEKIIPKKETLRIVVIDKDLKQFPELNSSLSIPFTHQQYNLIDKYGNQLSNEHAAVKPYFYNEITSFKKVASDKTALFKNGSTMLARKTWNENLIYIKGEDYWFSVNPMFDWQVGKDNSDIEYTFNNTRAVNVRGSIGRLSFSSSLYESQGRFASYINSYMRTLKPANAHAVFLGVGNSKNFKENSFDYPLAEGYVSYNANKHFTFQFGKGKNFIGDGYRSLLLSDNASPYTFAKISTTFWKVKYTNIWMWANDVRADSFTNDTYLRKFVASHHLSINITKKLNVGLFESTITNARSNPTMDIDFLNPIIFYRAVEYSRGSRSGNAMVGLNAKYKLKNANIYGQFILDELTVGEFFSNSGYWANKFGVQLGFHYYDAFKIKNLSLQGEANIVRPFTYSHNNTELNYSHYLQPLAHSWGSNFVEFIGIARYQNNRWFGNLKAIYGKKGFDYQDSDTSYGGNIFLSYNERGQRYNNNFFQGNTANIFIADLQVGYVVNPTTNLHIFANASMRNFKAKEVIPYFPETNTTWVTFGLKSDIFNSYFDF